MRLSLRVSGTSLRLNVSLIGWVLGAVVGLMLIVGGLHSARYPKLNVVFRPSQSTDPGMPMELRPVVTKSKSSRAFGIARMVLGASLMGWAVKQLRDSAPAFSSSDDNSHEG